MIKTLIFLGCAFIWFIVVEYLRGRPRASDFSRLTLFWVMLFGTGFFFALGVYYGMGWLSR
jgi:hypothetical protein